MKNTSFKQFKKYDLSRFTRARSINKQSFRTIALIAALGSVLTFTGCAGVSGGIGFQMPNLPNTPMKTLEERIKEKAAKTTIEYTAAAMQEAKPNGPGMIIIGTLGRKTEFGFFNRSSAYSSFVEGLKKNVAANIPTKEEFLATYDGAVLIATRVTPLLGFSGRGVLTIKGSDEKFGYASLAMMATFGPRGDLVLGQTTDHGTPYLHRTLCRKNDSDYEQCRDKYRTGTYDRESGKPISIFGNLDENGDGIDTQTLMRLDYKPSTEPSQPAMGRQRSFGSTDNN
jgi:hypothetical protein